MSYTVATVNLLGAILNSFFKVNIMIFVFLTIAIVFYFVWYVQRFDHSSNSKATSIVLMVVAAIILAVNIPLFIMTYKTTNVEITQDTIKIVGTYKRTITTSEVEAVKLLDSIPKIKMKTNGIGIGQIQKGNYKLEGIDKGFLYLESDTGPYIEIATKDYTFFINYKDDNKTSELFHKLTNELKLK